MKILILGHGGHGKDTAALMLQKLLGIKFASSSLFACERAVFPVLSEKYGYDTVQECYEDRRNHREEWKSLISDYNTPDKARLAKQILAENDCYVGMRCIEEFKASQHLFDRIIWIEADGRVPKDPSMKIQFDPINMDLVMNTGPKNMMFCDLAFYFSREFVSALEAA